MIPPLLHFVISALAQLVPQPERERWREEWLGELDEVAERSNVRTVVGVAAGAIPDALAVRRVVAERQRRGDCRRGQRSMRALFSGFSSMDFKLAVRMLVRYPGLTFVGVLGMAVGIAIAAGAFSIFYTFIDPALPLDEGDRIITIQNWDATRNNPNRRSLHDFASWREELTSVKDLGAYRQVGRNLIVPGVTPETVPIAEMSASGFRVARVPALMGRHLTDDDERQGAPAVLVIAYDVWRNRFSADPKIVGRSVQLGDTWYSIVGVMPEGFAFPVTHNYWIPFRVDPSRHERGTGPDLFVFGRLADDASIESAQSELTALGQRASVAFPKTNEHLRPKLLPYTFPFFDIDDPSTAWMIHLLQFLITLLLVIVCVNVAILVYARTARRQGEIAVRTALGASRRRIVGQLFAEALVLAGLAAALGLVVTKLGLRYINAAMLEGFGQLPFWWVFDLSPGLIVYVVGLTLLSAAIVGVVPALKATGRRVQTGLQSISAGGGAGMGMGRTWTVLIVAQVAFAVALLPAAVFHAWDSLRFSTADPGFASTEFLTTQMTLDRGSAPPVETDATRRDFRDKYARGYAELRRLLLEQPAVSDVTFSMAVPGEEATVVIEVDGVPNPEQQVDYNIREGVRTGHLVRFNRVSLEYFDIFDVRLLTGRGFHGGDTGMSASSVIVNRSFVQRFIGDGNPLGRRIRYVGRSGDAAPDHVQLGRWYEVVGVVNDFPVNQTESGLATAKLYHAADPREFNPLTITLRVRSGTPLEFVPRLREITAAVDPNLQLRRAASLDDLLRNEQGMMRIVALVLSALTLSVIVLSAAGIYALMSFTVSQRRKEIGIRTALGADQRRILAGIFSRALFQLAIGAVLGVIVAAVLDVLTEGGLMQGNGAIVLPIVAVFMMIVGVVAALGPARRGLRIQPTEALRTE